MLRPVTALAALAFAASAIAQTTTTTLTPAAQQVQLLAPQLVPFAGSTGNFDSLVNGLTLGAPITLTTVTPDGLVQIVTFLPGSTLSPLDAARQLETARQNLITRGIATPTAQQLAVSLVGGTLPTVAGSTTINGVITGAAGGTTPIQVRSEIASAAALPAGSSTLNLSAADLQALRTGLAQGSPITLGATTPTGASQVSSFSVPGGPMNAFEVNQSLQLASALLAQQGILNPTPDQIRVALVGGTLTGISGANIPVQGVLQGRVTSTSTSPAFNTSNSPFFGTSNTPPSVAPVATPAPVVSPLPSPVISPLPSPVVNSIAPPVDGVRRGNTAEGASRVRPATRPGG